MPNLVAACTPNSLPREDGRVDHGYQLTVLDESMKVVDTVDLPDWETFRREELDAQLNLAGYVLRPSETGWSPAGLGFMASVVRAANQ
ncbi:hypothetical protein [Streptomyces sp. NBC_01435]|uniref:hypothetical protein n=1 Tax=Streptomyces sp. NBC_01435 TaxID=2903865 RepID=UPI002E2FDF70|nr:hypothetical protein [Streptomyces sp. NBC_01435]